MSARSIVGAAILGAALGAGAVVGAVAPHLAGVDTTTHPPVWVMYDAARVDELRKVLLHDDDGLPKSARMVTCRLDHAIGCEYHW